MAHASPVFRLAEGVHEASCPQPLRGIAGEPRVRLLPKMLPDLKAWEDNRLEVAPKLLVASAGIQEANRVMGLAGGARPGVRRGRHAVGGVRRRRSWGGSGGDRGGTSGTGLAGSYCSLKRSRCPSSRRPGTRRFPWRRCSLSRRRPSPRRLPSAGCGGRPGCGR